MGSLILVNGIVYGILIDVLAALFVVGTLMLVKGIKTQKKNKKTNPVAAKKGVVHIVMGSIMILPLAVILGSIGVGAIKTAVHNHSSLYYQLYDGKVGGLERLLKKGACVEDACLPEERPARDGERTMLGSAARYSIDIPDGTEKIALLIEYGADVNRTMCDYCEYGHPNGKHHNLCSATPVLFACTQPNYNALKLLIDSGGDVNAVDYDGNSALDLIDEKLQDHRLHPNWKKIYKQMRELLIQNGAKSAKTDKTEEQQEE